MISCPLLSPRGKPAKVLQPLPERTDTCPRSTGDETTAPTLTRQTDERAKNRGRFAREVARGRRAAWFSGRLSGFISGSRTISAHREGNLPALLQSALPLELSCHCNGPCESPEHQQAQKKKKKGKTLPTRSHINTQVRAHTGRTLHLDTKHLSGAVGTCRLPVCFSLQRLMLLTSERGGA